MDWSDKFISIQMLTKSKRFETSHNNCTNIEINRNSHLELENQRDCSILLTLIDVP